MSSFAYKARKADGTLASGRLSAENRIAAISALQRQGLTPVKSWRLRRAGKEAQPLSRGRIAVIGGTVLVVALLVWWQMKPAKPAKGKPASKQAVAAEQAKVAKRTNAVARAAERSMPREAAPARQAQANAVAAAKNAPQRQTAKTATPAAPDAIPSEEPVVTNRPAFQSASEEVLHMLASVVPGDFPPPIPNFPAFDDIPKILDRDILVYNDDDEETVHAKENVAIMKNQLKKYLQNGGKPQEFLSYYRDWLAEAATKRSTMTQEAKRIIREEGTDAAKEYLKECNDSLHADGVKEVTIPDRIWALAPK